MDILPTSKAISTIKGLFCAVRILYIVIMIFGLQACRTLPIVKPLPNLNNHALVTEDGGILSEFAPYRDSLNAALNQAIGYADTAFFAGSPNGNLNNLVADFVLQQAQEYLWDITIQACILNRGGLRTALPKDSIRLFHIYEIMPFENELVLLQISGSGMDSAMKHIAQLKGAAVSGMELTLTDSGYSTARIAGSPYDGRREYWIATNDYMAQGGDGFNMLPHALSRVDTGIKLRDIFIENIRKECRNGPLQHRTDIRIH
jgi:2',3'-cyclic-nucleotide 2'-phosphodiesterase (5'-nucleotidase family)